ncbi:MAG: ketopantoate reductase family protein [Ancalomicrobiaceae bacterium]|nr:ketopantoate reductase family protein [Ancalomicrobiaceae bacterium]
MRLLIVGAGSTGGWLGVRLVEAGADVTFLTRPARAAQLRRDGLRLSSPFGDATLQPKVVVASEIDAPYDAVILTVKGFQLDAAIDDIAAAVGPETMILTVLNGMRHVDALARRFPTSNLVGCLLKVSTLIEDDGRIVQLSTLQELVYGELDGTPSPRILAFDAAVKPAAIGARLSDAIRREMWEKWVLLASLGAITCLMRGSIGEIEACAGGAEFELAVLEEVLAVVRAVGVPPSEAFVAAARVQLTAKGSPFASSMFRDLERGRPVEVDAIIGDLLARGTGAGIATPLLSAANVHLQVYRARLAPGSTAP